MKSNLLIFIFFILLQSCNGPSKDDLTTEIESTIKLKLPTNIKILKNNEDGAIGDYSTITDFIILDKISLSTFTKRIRKSNDYKANLSGSTPHDTTYYYWTKENQNYIFGNNGFNSIYISFVLDTITGKAHFCLHED